MLRILYSAKLIKWFKIVLFMGLLVSCMSCSKPDRHQTEKKNEKDVAWMYGGLSYWSTPLEFSADGKYLLTRGARAQKLWETKSGNLIHVFKDENTYQAGRSVCRFSPDGGHVVVNDSGCVKFWDVKLRKFSLTFAQPRGWALAAIFNATGDTMVTGGIDSSIRIWSVSSGTLLRKIPVGDGIITSLQFIKDNRYLIASEGWRKIWVWDTERKTITRRFIGRLLGPVVSDSLVSSALLAIADPGEIGRRRGPAIRIYDLISGKQTGFLGTGKTWGNNNYVFSPGGHSMAVKEPYGVNIYDLHAGKIKTTLTAPDSEELLEPVRFTPDGKYIETFPDTAGTLQFDAVTGLFVRKIASTGPRGSIAFSPDSSICLRVGSQSDLIVVDVASGKKLSTIARHSGYIKHFVLTPDGSKLVVDEGISNVAILNTRDGSMGEQGEIYSNAIERGKKWTHGEMEIELQGT